MPRRITRTLQTRNSPRKRRKTAHLLNTIHLRAMLRSFLPHLGACLLLYILLVATDLAATVAFQWWSSPNPDSGQLLYGIVLLSFFIFPVAAAVAIVSELVRKRSPKRWITIAATAASTMVSGFLFHIITGSSKGDFLPASSIASLLHCVVVYFWLLANRSRAEKRASSGAE